MKSDSPLLKQIDKSIDKKVSLFSNSLSRYAVHAMLVCLFLTLGTAVALAIAIKGEGISHGSGKTLYAFMFSWSLMMILYMNAEFGTSNMLYMTVGIYRKRVNSSLAAKILFTYTLFNLIGGVLSDFLVSFTVPFQNLPKGSFFLTSIAGKLEKTTLQILIEAMFANVVVNTAVLVSIQVKDDTGRVTAIIFVIFTFALLGSGHVIANFPAFSLAHFTSNNAIEAFITGNVVHDPFWVFIGNFIGGGLIMGLGYAWLGKDSRNLMYLDQLTNQLY